MANTGGTAAPRTTSVVKTTPSGVTIRHSAAAQSLGAPKGGAGKPLTVTPQAQPKPSKVPRMPAAHKAAAQHRAPAPRAAPARSQLSGHNVFNPLAGTLSSPQLERLSQNITRGQMQNELEPLQRQGREIQGTEGRVQGAFAGAGQTQQNLLGGIGTEAQANAKTASNLAAENALKVSKGIETSGQQQASMTAGYMSPELRQELAAGAERGAATGVAGTNFAASQGLNEQNYMGNLRAAAAARTTEGGRQIAGIYGKQLGTVRGKEADLIAKQPVAARTLATELGQKQFTNFATAQGLGIKAGTLQQKETASQRTAATARRGQNVTARGQDLTRKSAQEGHKITRSHYEQVDKRARERGSKAAKASGPASPAHIKLAEGLSSAYETVRQLQEQKLSPTQIRNVLSTGSLRANVGGKPTTLRFSKIANQTLVKAAFDLYTYHYVNPQTIAALQAMGLTTDPNAVVGVAKPTAATGVVGGVQAGTRK